MISMCGGVKGSEITASHVLRDSIPNQRVDRGNIFRMMKRKYLSERCELKDKRMYVTIYRKS